MNVGLNNQFLFKDDQLELDTDRLTQAVVIVVQVKGVARFVGQVTRTDGTIGEFLLAVAQKPAEPSVNIDISVEWPTIPTFTVGENGYVIVSVSQGAGGQAVRIFNDSEVLVDNKHFQQGQTVVLRLLRPGKHQIKDIQGGGVCNLTVDYPERGKTLRQDPITLTVESTGKDQSEIKPPSAEISVIQPIMVIVDKDSHIVTRLLATTDRRGDALVITETLR